MKKNIKIKNHYKKVKNTQMMIIKITLKRTQMKSVSTQDLLSMMTKSIYTLFSEQQIVVKLKCTSKIMIESVYIIILNYIIKWKNYHHCLLIHLHEYFHHSQECPPNYQTNNQTLMQRQKVTYRNCLITINSILLIPFS